MKLLIASWMPFLGLSKLTIIIGKFDFNLNYLLNGIRACYLLTRDQAAQTPQSVPFLHAEHCGTL
jgi:hypothetical protein